MRTPQLIAALFLALPICLSAQANSGDDIFTITVAPPVSPQDVQVRYVLNGDPQVQQSASIAKPDESKIVVKTGVEDKPAKGFRAIVFAPGCQFAAIKADDLFAATRQAEFQCHKLATSPLHGRAEISRFAGKDLRVEVLYMCDWAGQFFGVPNLAISPFSVVKGPVAADGTFTVELPDFSSDPLWASLSHNATLAFSLVDASNGEHLAR